MKDLLLHYVRFGPYHLARLKSAQKVLGDKGWRVRGLQICASDSTYAWERVDQKSSQGNGETDSNDHSETPSILTVFPDAHYESLSKQQLFSGVRDTLDKLNPTAISIAGWSTSDAKACLKWCMVHNRTRILMSETRRVDGKRVWWKEWLKSQIVKRFHGGLVGSESHASYLSELGMPQGRIARGYNIVDNQFFIEAVDQLRSTQDQTIGQNEPSPFFLGSNRFVPIKNLERALKAYAKLVQAPANATRWNLCLIGDGPQQTEMIALAKSLGLETKEAAPWQQTTENSATVFFPGFVQIGALPEYYSRAGAFLHPAISEPWGLVINEAMASALPVVASRNGGAAETLLEDGQTGYRFDPLDVDDIFQCMQKLSALQPIERREMGLRARQLLLERMPVSKFGNGLEELLNPQGD